MRDYNLEFVSNVDLYNHVKNTVAKYKFNMNLKTFNNNLIDPIKLTFDSKIYQRNISEIIDNEILRQIDKSNTNHIGYFHQNIFKYIGNGWIVPNEGFDVVNETQHIFVELKNKHNTMNSSSSQKTYMKMQSKLLEDDQATCYLVEVIAKNSQDIKWKVTLDKKQHSHNKIRRMSIDKFYELITGNPTAFRDLCQVIPIVIEDIIQNLESVSMKNSVFEELRSINENMLKSLYLLSFSKYEGFNEFQI